MHSHIESILLVASRPLRYTDIARALDADATVVAEVIEELKARYNTESSGIHIFVVDDTEADNNTGCGLYLGRGWR